MPNFQQVISYAVIVTYIIGNPSIAQARTEVLGEVPSVVTAFDRSQLDRLPAGRSYEDLLSAIPQTQYPGVLGQPGDVSGESCSSQGPQLGPRFKDSVNWPGLSAPGSYMFDQARQGQLAGPSQADIEGFPSLLSLEGKYKGGGMTQIDPPVAAPPTVPLSNDALTESRADLEAHLAKSQKKLKNIVDKFGADNIGTAEARRILEADIAVTQDKLAQAPSESGSIPDLSVEYTPKELAEFAELSRQLSPEQMRRNNTDPFGDLNNDGSPASEQDNVEVAVEEIKYTPEELESMSEMLTPEEIRRINTDPFGMNTPAPALAPGLSKGEALDYAAAFAALMDTNVKPEDMYEAYQNNLKEYTEMNAAERAKVMADAVRRHAENILAQEMVTQAEVARQVRLADIERQQTVQEEQKMADLQILRDEVNRASQEILSGIEEYVNNAGEYDPYILKWVSVAAEMQHETKKLADSVNRDFFRAEAKLQAIKEYEQVHAAELAAKPWLARAISDMKYQAGILKVDAERVWLQTKELVWFGAVIDVATFWITAAVKGVGVARRAAQEALMRKTLDAARKPTGYVVGDIMVNAAGEGAEAAAEKFMGSAGSQAVAAGTSVVATGAQSAVTQAVGQASGNVASDAGESVVAAGVKELLEGPEMARSFWVKMNILKKGTPSEMKQLIEYAKELGIPESQIEALKNSPSSLGQLIIEKTGGKIVEFAEARPIFEISTRVLSGGATQADRQVLEKMIAESSAQGGNFFEDLARKGTFGDDGFQPIATGDVIDVLKGFVGTGAANAADKTVMLAGQGAEHAATLILDNALDKTVKLAPEQAGRLAVDALQGAFDKTVQLAPDQAAALADTVIDKILDKTVKLTPAQVENFIKNVADDVLDKTVLMNEEQAFRMAQTLVENLMEHAPTLTPAEISNMSTTIIGNVLDDTVRLSESQIRAFIGKVADETFTKTVQMSELETQKLTQSMISRFMEETAQDAGAQTVRMAEAALQDAMKTQILPNQALRLAETVLDDVLMNTTIITRNTALELTETVVGEIMDKTTKLTTAQAQDFISTVILKVSEKTLIMGERDAADLVATVVGEVLEKTVMMSQEDLIKTVRLAIDKTLVKTMSLTPAQAADLTKTVTGDVLDHLALTRAPQGPSLLTMKPAVPVEVPVAAAPVTSASNAVTKETAGLMPDMLRAELEGEKKSLLEQIAGMEKGLSDPIFKKNADLRATLTETLASARERLAEVEGLLSQSMNALTDISLSVDNMVKSRLTDGFGILSGYQLPFTGASEAGGTDLMGGYLSVERFGELAGETGPVLVKGTYQNQPGVVVYDSWGIPTGFITRDEARYVPSHTVDLLRQADALSQRYVFEGGFGKWPLRSQIYMGYDYAPIKAGDNPPAGFVPESVLSPQLGMSGLDIFTFADGINGHLIKGVSGEKFFDPFSCCGTVYLYEPVYDRVIQKKKPVVTVIPNDPRYLDPKGARKMKTRLLLKSASSTSLGGGLMLGNSSSDKGLIIVDQWGIREAGYTPINEPESAWSLVDADQKNVIVAVIDSGFDLTHPDRPQYIWTNEGEIAGNGLDDDHNGYVDDEHGYNFLDNNGDLTDHKGHGTNVAGIIAAKSNNGIGIAGINPGAQIMVLKVADKFGHANSFNIYRAIRYAANHGARVINISLGAWGNSKLEQLAINYAYRRGVFIVVASGNENRDMGEYGPSGRRRVFAVGSTDYGGARSQISNHGPNLALLAPGEQIYTLWAKEADWDGPSGDRERRYWKATGTSFSAPIVAATASLILAKRPELRPWEVEKVLLSSAIDMEEAGWDIETGSGFLDAYAALSQDPSKTLAVLITELKVNEIKGELDSLDVFATVEGDLSDFVVEIAKGKKPRTWQNVGETFTQPAQNSWLCRIPAKLLKGPKEWTLRVTAKGRQGEVKQAQQLIILK